MRVTAFRSNASYTVMVAALLGMALSACQKASPDASTAAATQPATAPPIAALPLATAPPPAPMAYAPVATALPPPTGRVRVALRHDRDRYGYVDRASAMNRAFGDTPPDYTVDYGGTRPWVWRSNDGSYRVAEQLPEGERMYYYERGADHPFYVSDPEGGYAYDGDTLVGVYGPDGAPLSDEYAQRRSDQASRYYDRSRVLYHSAQYSPRQAAYADNWQARRDFAAQQQQRWDQTRSRDDQWQAWHDQHQQEQTQTWQGEQDRRTAYAVAIGAAVIGGAVLLSTRHSGERQNQPGYSPDTAPRAAAPASGGNYGQRANPNPQPAMAPAMQQRPAPTAQTQAQRPVPVQAPPAAYANHPDNRPQRQSPAAVRPAPTRITQPVAQRPVPLTAAPRQQRPASQPPRVVAPPPRVVAAPVRAPAAVPAPLPVRAPAAPPPRPGRANADTRQPPARDERPHDHGRPAQQPRN